MAKSVVIDEIHLTIRIPSDLPENRAGAIRDTLAGGDFTARLRRAVRDVVRAFPELHVACVSLTR